MASLHRKAKGGSDWVISVSDLRKVYRLNQSRGLFNTIFRPESKEVVAVNNISFEVPEGDFIGYVGPNGAGKSTTIKMLAGVLVPSSGTIKVDGKTP